MTQKTNYRPRHGASLALATLLAATIAAGPAQAGERSPGYQYDANGHILRDAAGNCLRTAAWAPSNALPECDPDAAAGSGDNLPVREMRGRITETTAAKKGAHLRAEAILLNAGESFAFDSATLEPRGKELIAAAVDTFKDEYIRRVLVVGHSDRIGNPEYNMKLSKQRAEAVAAELVHQGIPSERITVVAKGDEDPLVICEGFSGKALIQCLAPNRRTEILFVMPRVAVAVESEFVERRRSDEVKASDISERALVSSPAVTANFNKALKIVGDGCSKEIAAYCDDVPVGRYRLVRCLDSHRSELSASCVDAMAKGRSIVDATLGDINFFGAQCGRDVKNRCPDVQPGGGRLIACLKDKIGKVTKRCVDAMLELDLIDYDPFGRR
jgi:OOP family OmpA-OmpF porin